MHIDDLALWAGEGESPDLGPSAVVPCADDALDLVSYNAEPKQHEPRNKFQPRSWELAKHMRASKKLKAVERKYGTLKADNEVLGKALAATSALDSSIVNICRQLGVQVGSCMHKAAIVARIAFVANIKGDFDGRHVQTRASSIVAQCALTQQREWTLQHIAGLMAKADDVDVEDLALGVNRPVHVITWQWDETSQRVRSLLGNRLKGERLTRHKVSAQIMMQSGTWDRYHVEGESCTLIDSNKMLARGCMLSRQSANFLIEGMSRAMPFFFDDIGDVRALALGSVATILSFSCDRASANFRTCAWIWKALEHSPDNFLPHLEPCALHAVHLVKCRPKEAKQLIGSISILSSCLRDWRFGEALRESILTHVRLRLDVQRVQRPDAQKVKATAVMDALFPQDEYEWCFDTDTKGERKKKRVRMDLEALANAVEFGSNASDKIIHHCCVEADSPEALAGMRIGGPCCTTEAESVEKVVAPILNWIVHNPLSSISASRWTHVVTGLRKTLAGILAQRVLPESLRSMQVHWGTHDGVIAALERAVAADEDDFKSKSKLRLLRVCKALCPERVGPTIALALQCVLAVDHIMYQVLGDGRRKRATLKDLCGHESSSIASAQDKIVQLLDGWGANAPIWQLFHSTGGSADDDEFTFSAKSQLLQQSAALLDHLELRMCNPPYSLIKLVDAGVPDVEARQAAIGFFKVSDHCLNTFCKRLKALYPNRSALVCEGKKVIQAWAESSCVAIDGTERSHGQMRQDLRTEKRARNFTRSSNKMVCSEVRVGHIARGGLDPAKINGAEFTNQDMRQTLLMFG
jgi:hypothetical protein